uniref:G-protein coupled receptors family 2 profile 1 domain-containing protein n=1 Tax=Scleropages formosus TaxID=113540 RepID=A0A8C9WBU8_SCLFO
MGSILEDVIYKRTEYWENLIYFFSVFIGIYCNGSFDLFVCWPHSPVGNVSVPCPSYLPWIKEGTRITKYSILHCYELNLNITNEPLKQMQLFKCIFKNIKILI